MSYIINTTAGDVLLTLQDGTTDSSTGLTLIGRNYTGYGNLQNENFVKLLENFASPNPPAQSVAFKALTGSIWYDTANRALKVYDGQNYNTVSGRTTSTTAPTAKAVGDQWWDTVNLQLKSWTGSAWQVIGPAYTAGQGITGTIPGTIVDTNVVVHTVANTYAHGNLVSITSSDVEFTPAGYIAGFNTIAPGINLLNTAYINGNTKNSQTVGGISATQFARTDVSSTFAQDINVTGNVVLGHANVQYANNGLVFKNGAHQGNLDVYVNSTTGITNALHVDGATGLVSVYGDPTANVGIATKQYADNAVASAILALNNTVGQLQYQISGNIATVISSTNSNLRATNTGIYSNIASVIGSISSLHYILDLGLANLASNAAVQEAEIAAINSQLPGLATLVSPVFTGIPQAPTATSGDNSTTVATTAYVDSSTSLTNTNLNNSLSVLRQNVSTYIAANVAGLASTTSPVFAGTPTAPTPTAGDNTTKIATTAFVQQATAAAQFNYSVSTNPPGSGGAGGISSTNGYAGNPGDFWFQVG
jgi:hypothetical protein